MSASASRRDDTDRSLARSAWKSVPRKKEPSRRVRYDQVRRTTRTIEQGAKQIRRFTAGTHGNRDRRMGVPAYRRVAPIASTSLLFLDAHEPPPTPARPTPIRRSVSPGILAEYRLP